jgi:restriction system protein
MKQHQAARSTGHLAWEKAREEAEQQKRERVTWWQKLDGYEFERELTTLFRARGLTAHQRGGAGDGGVDIELKIGDRRVLVQCKAHKTRVSPGAVRDLYGTLLHSGADEAWLVTTVGFNSAAEEFAMQKPIRLLTIARILEEGWKP